MTDNTADDRKSQTQTKTDDIERLMAAIGQAHLSAGYPVNEVNDTLSRISQAYDRPQQVGS